MPNDETEQTRLAIAHQAYLPALDDQLTVGLIPRSAKRILDIGTGTGDWAYVFPEFTFFLWNLIVCPKTCLKNCPLSRRVPKLAVPPQASKTDSETTI